ncbi:MAG TPA: type II secretion system F family protein [Streptosporangiaceae bacterium]|nr:type II secretion system F family protein [Streptosporangiaceae bacterium]
MSRLGTAARAWTVLGLTTLLAPLALSSGTVAAHAAERSRVVVILLDTNISPAKTQMADERKAALAYVRALPADVEIGLIAFNDTWQTALQPTSSRPQLTAALAAAQPAGATSNGLKGALAGAVAMVDRLGAKARSRLLVLTDGEFMTQPKQAVPIPVDAITWHYDADDYVNIVQQVATASGGHSADPGKASGLVKYIPPKPRATAPPAAPVAQPRWHLTQPLLSVLALVFVALLVLALLGLRSLRRGPRRPQIASRIERYGPQGASPATSSPDRDGKLAVTAVNLMGRLLTSSNSQPRLARRLDHAGIARPPAEWALLGVCLSVGLAAVFTVAFGNVGIGVIVGSLAGWAVMRLVLSVKIGRRRAAFDEQLPNVLQLVAGSIQTGLSLSQALDAVVREDAQPASGEFARALGEARLGVQLDVALDGVADRLNSGDLRWVIMAIRIQRETGGNLAEVLRNTVATMRERAYLRRQVRSLSAEGRLSAYVLIALPFVVGGWLLYSSPAYMRPLFTTAFGVLLLILASVLVVVGAFWMRNLIKVEV